MDQELRLSITAEMSDDVVNAAAALRAANDNPWADMLAYELLQALDAARGVPEPEPVAEPAREWVDWPTEPGYWWMRLEDGTELVLLDSKGDDFVLRFEAGTLGQNRAAYRGYAFTRANVDEPPR